MIVRPRPSLLQLFFIARGSIIGQILPQLVTVFAVSACVAWVHDTHPGWLPRFTSAPFTLLGIALSIFLGFRNNAGYERWWEARKQWGHLIAIARRFARQGQLLANAPPGGDPALRECLHKLTIAFAHALVLHLRPGQDDARVRPWLDPETLASCDAGRNRPEIILRMLSSKLAQARRNGVLSDIQYQLLEQSVGEMGAVQAACERIATTPVPFAYTLLLHRTAYLFCFLLPFGLIDALGSGMPVMTVLVAYTFFGLDALAGELEQPFGERPNHLPIGALATTIEINLREALGEVDLPPMPEPAQYVLM